VKPSDYSLLLEFEKLFAGNIYKHRDSSLGDRVALYLYEDLRRLNRSTLLSERIDSKTRVANIANRTVGIAHRRGDGTFGELVPVAVAITEDGFSVARGPVASVEIGAETKILAKAMIKQIDRVVGDLVRQTEEFKRNGQKPLCVAIVGVNFSPKYTSYEGSREFPTDGGKNRHPIQEAEKAIARLEAKARPHFDEFLTLKFSATNVAPFPFKWLKEEETLMQYSALLTRVCKRYDERFS
jgi:hypothetical protein